MVRVDHLLYFLGTVVFIWLISFSFAASFQAPFWLQNANFTVTAAAKST
jgi:hypothetical protein